MNKISKWSVLLGSSALLLSCSNSSSTDSASSGKVKIYVEESYKPLFKTSIYTYESQYPNTHIEPIYCSEQDVIDAFIANKTKTIFMTRDFTKSEKVNLRKSLVEVRSEILAKDAVAFIVHPSNVDTNLTVEQIKRIFTGKDLMWPTSKSKINVVFDNPNSANFRFMSELTHSSKVPDNVFAVKSNEEVINYVKNHPNAIGVIGVNWISDEDDANVLDFLNGINVIALSDDDSGYFYKPYQAYIYDKSYPLTRELWVINKGARTGLNSGFVNFLEGEKGQLIVKKSSLVPFTAPVRLIEIKTE